MNQPLEPRFVTTAWSLIQAAKTRPGADGSAALGQLIAAYWPPVFHFVLGRGVGVQQAEDLTQQFFVSLLEDRWLETADRERGRFRNFLLRVLVRFLSDQGPRRGRRQPVFENKMTPMSALADGSWCPDATQTETAEEQFMRGWARAVIEAILLRVEQWCRRQSREDWYQVFLAHQFSDTRRRPTQTALARKFSLSRDQVRHALQKTRERFLIELHEELCDQAGNEADVADELAELEKWLARPLKGHG